MAMKPGRYKHEQLCSTQLKCTDLNTCPTQALHLHQEEYNLVISAKLKLQTPIAPGTAVRGKKRKCIQLKNNSVIASIGTETEQLTTEFATRTGMTIENLTSLDQVTQMVESVKNNPELKQKVASMINNKFTKTGYSSITTSTLNAGPVIDLSNTAKQKNEIGTVAGRYIKVDADGNIKEVSDCDDGSDDSQEMIEQELKELKEAGRQLEQKKKELIGVESKVDLV